MSNSSEKQESVVISCTGSEYGVRTMVQKPL